MIDLTAAKSAGCTSNASNISKITIGSALIQKTTKRSCLSL